MNNNPFKILETREPVPEELKNKVIASVKSAQLFMDIADLFSLKIGETIGELFKIKENKK